jgi:hypothetical protein
MDSKRQKALENIIQMIQTPHEKVIQIDNDFNRKTNLSELGYNKIFSNEKKALEDRQNFVYILGEYKFAGPHEAVYDILSKLGISSEIINSIEINFNNYKTKKISKPLVNSNISDIRNLYKKNKINNNVINSSPTGKRSSIKENIQIKKTMKSISCENNIKEIKHIIMKSIKNNQGLDISSYVLDGDTNKINNLKLFLIKENTNQSKKFCIPFFDGYLVIASKNNLCQFLKDIKYENIDELINSCKLFDSKLQVTKKICYPVKDEFPNVRTQKVSPCPSP